MVTGGGTTVVTTVRVTVATDPAADVTAQEVVRAMTQQAPLTATRRRTLRFTVPPDSIGPDLPPGEVGTPER